MVAPRVDRTAAQAAVALDPHTLLARLDRRAQRRQRGADGGDPVALLAAQLGRVADRRRALGEAGGESDERQLVDRQRDLAAADFGPAQLCKANAQPAARLAAALALGLDLD